jgi:predicted ATPase/DNA-binding SARP family transcriptional activator
MVSSGRVVVDVLGPVRARTAEGRDLTPGGVLQRRLLALLVLRRGEVVSTDAVVDALWGEDPPVNSVAAIQTHVFRLRRRLPDRAITGEAGGYRLDPETVVVDADRLAEAVADGAPDAIERALGSWRGTPYPELADTDDGRMEAGRLDELRTRAEEERAGALVAAGRSADVLADLSRLVDRAPLRERPVELLMAALAAEGRTAEALRAYDDLRRRLGDELGIEPSAALAAEYERLLRGGAVTGRAEPAGSWAGWESRLPVAATPLIGRDELVQTALAMAIEHRLVTMLGTGGVGKTRLAVEVAHRLAGERPPRPVLFCELAVASPATAHEAVARTLGIETKLGTELRDRIASVLHREELVLVLDNCEHVLEPVAELVEGILGRTTGVSVLATSRERLRLPGEHLCPVPPLPDEGAHGPAVELFVARARAVRPGWQPTGEERAVVAEVVHRLDGLPLAIELAAARVHTLEVEEIAAALDRRFRLLTAGYRTSTRHRSLHAAVSWSVDLLEPSLRDFLAEVSVFAGAFSPTAAADVTGTAEDVADDRLHRLAERSLAARAPAGRFALLETIRAFGAELLAQAGRAEIVGERHADRMLAWAEDARRRLRDPAPNPVLEELDVELPDLRVAMEWFVGRRDVERASRLVDSLVNLGFLRLRPEVLGWAEQVVALDPDGSDPRSGAAHAAGSLAAWMAGDLVAAGRWADRAMDLATGRGPLPVVVTDAAANQALFEGRLDEAVRWYRRSMEAAVDDPVEYAISACCEVLALAYAGDETAEARARDLLRDVGEDETPGAAYASYAAGEAALRTDPALSRRHHERAMALAAATGASFVTGAAGASLASLEARHGDPAVAAASYRWLIDHWRRVGMWSMQWTMLRSVALLLERIERPREAGVLASAVTNDGFGHAVFGDDAVALQQLSERLRRRLGDEGWDAAAAEGRSLDGDAVVEFALRAR